MDLGWIILIVLAVIVIGGIVIYNSLVSLRQRVRNAEADIDVQLRQRADLVPQLVETVKGYASHESKVLADVIAARQGAAQAGSLAEKAAADQQMSRAVGSLMALAESYPDLKANQNFMSLQSQLQTIEDKIAAARRFLNNAAAEFNAAIEQFPAVLFAGALGFKPSGFYELPADRAASMQEPANVKF
jgi:LemA protein